MALFNPKAVHRHAVRCFSPTASAFRSPQPPRRSINDETTLASAKHKPSLSGPSLGHLISELSATTPEMLKAGSRREGHTMNEEHRTLARKVAIGIVGLPLAFGSVVVGGTWLWGEDHAR
ncbi:hypothetical protein BDR22DRAFT_819394 [Usnea florida]